MTIYFGDIFEMLMTNYHGSIRVRILKKESNSFWLTITVISHHKLVIISKQCCWSQLWWCFNVTLTMRQLVIIRWNFQHNFRDFIECPYWLMMAGLARFFEEIIASTLNVMCFCISDDFERLCNYKRVKRVKLVRRKHI